MEDEMTGTWPSPGPLEMGSFPEKLTARVVTPGTQPCVHGYDVESDLALHYSVSEVAYLATTGELPRPEFVAALDAVLVFASALSVAHAPTHAAVVARLCGAPATSILSIAAIGLAEQTRYLLDEHEELLRWLSEPTAPFPSAYCANDGDGRIAVDHLRSAMENAGLHVPALAQHPTRNAAVLAALHRCGLVTRFQLEAMLVWVRLPVVMAEAMLERVANFKEYPVNLPRYTYQESAP